MKQFFPPEIIEYTAESHFTKQGRSKRVIYVAVLPALKTCRVQFAFLLFFLVLIPELSFSKYLTIEGKIQNHKTNEPIPYANIAVEGSYYGTVSNENGDFRLVIPDKLSNKSISFYSIGYENFSIPINNISGVVNVFLKQFDFQITDLFIMLPVGKAYQLGITVIVVLVTYNTKLGKIGGIYSKIDTFTLDDFNPGGFLQ